MFDESYEIVGDYEFFLRAVSLGCKFSFVPKAEGLMLWHRDALSTKSSDVYAEKKILFKNYRTPEKILDIYQNVLFHPNRTDQTDHMLDLGIRCLSYYPQFSNGSPHFDFSFAQYCFEHIPESKLRFHNLEALEKVRRASVPENSPIVPNTKVVFWSSTQDFPTEAELNCAKPTYLTRSGTKELDGKIHQMFEFDLDIFFSNLFGHLPAVNLSKAKNLFIWGLNERGKLLINFLNRDSARKATFIDSKAKILKDSQSDASFSLIDFEEVSAPSDSVFVLAMSSHHWPAITDKITKNFPAANIFTIDQS